MKKEVIILMLLLMPFVYATELIISPEITENDIGENFTIDIVLENNESLYGLDFKLNKINNLELVDYAFLNRTNNSMTNFVEETNTYRFGILFATNTNGLTTGNGAIIRLTYQGNETLEEELLFSNVFLSDKNGNEIQTNTNQANVTITEPAQPITNNAHLTCTGSYGYQGETVTIQIYLHNNKTDIGGIDFYQNFGSKVIFKSATTTSATTNGMLATNPETGKVRIGIAGVNITQTETIILNVKYEITAATGGSILTFSTVKISDTEGNLIEITTNKMDDCTIDIETLPDNSNTGIGAGGGSDSSNSNSNTNANTNAGGGITPYTSLLGKQKTKEIEQEQPVFHTQTTEEETEESEKEETTVVKKRTSKAVPIAIVGVTALMGIALYFVFGYRKNQPDGEY